jgi:hypothetical protein
MDSLGKKLKSPSEAESLLTEATASERERPSHIPEGRHAVDPSPSRRINRTLNAPQATVPEKLRRRRANKEYKTHKTGLNALRLLGERHSGTNFVTDLLLECFPTINIHTTLVTQKHWIQHSPEYVQAAMTEFGNDAVSLQAARSRYGAQFSWPELAARGKTAFNATFVVVVTRNPYDWMEAMRLLPHHWPNHVDYQSSAPDLEKRKQLLKQARERAFRKRMEGDPRIRRDSSRAKSLLQKQRQSRRAPIQFIESRRRRRLKDTMPQSAFKVLVSAQEKAKKTESFGTLNFIPTNWQDFVTRKLTVGKERPSGGARLCQKGYRYGTISPCILTRRYAPEAIRVGQMLELPGSLNEPVYELREDGTQFDHPLSFRAAKILHWIDLPKIWDLGGFVVVRYEDFKEQGSVDLVNAVSNAFGLLPKCKEPRKADAEKGRYELDSKFESWITQHTDWEAEARLGYEKRQ